jgi:protocatechuate 3,4-dioxygenase beta subunit
LQIARVRAASVLATGQLEHFVAYPGTAALLAVPAVYSGRTRHYHVKDQAPGSRLLTTQFYFPDEPANLRDGLFQRELLMRVADAGDGPAGWFDFVLNIR